MNKRSGAQQHQFLNVVDRDEAERRFLAALDLRPVGEDQLPLDQVLGRILSRDVVAAVDVPSFDRSNVDGFAVRAADTAGATEQSPRRLKLTGEQIPTAKVPQRTIRPGSASPIATGGMLPRGADAIVMIEHTDCDEDGLLVQKSVSPGGGISFAGSDIGAGETVLRRGERLTSRETGVLAAIGVGQVYVWKRPTVAIISTGDEIIEPGEPMRPGFVYDSNAQILADAVRELGALPLPLGIVGDQLPDLENRLNEAMARADVVVLSGGTSKGEGDLCSQAVGRLTDPGIVAHGVALKPGKPLCLAAARGKPVVILPGFPTSAVFTFHEFVAPVIRRLAGAADELVGEVDARLATKVNSEIGRTEYLLVGLVGDVGASAMNSISAYPMGSGSGSVTTFSRADGFVTIDRHRELLEEGESVRVRLLGRELSVADLVIIGSHCVGVDCLIGHVQKHDLRCKFLAVGSTAGLAAARRGECDIAGIHLLEPATQTYNTPFISEGLTLERGYRRKQGIIYRSGDPRFEDRTAEEALRLAISDPECRMINRNPGSGTRILVDQLLQGARPDGYASQPRSHNAVASAIAQHRADWGLAIERVALQLGLGFNPVADEIFDFVIPTSRRSRPAVQRWLDCLRDPEIQAELRMLGLQPYAEDAIIRPM